MPEQYFLYGETELRWLSERDPALGAYIHRMEPPRRRLLPDLYSGLIYYILGQQISAAAAATEWNRFQKAFDPVTPEHIASIPEEEIQQTGTTFRRAGYIRAISRQGARGDLDLAAFSAFPDNAFCRELVKLPGVGRWTAEMLLIHVLQRPDIIIRRALNPPGPELLSCLRASCTIAAAMIK